MADPSFAQRTAQQASAELERVQTAWLNLATSRDPKHVAAAMRWFGRHLTEYAWRMEMSFEVDALGAQLEAGVNTVSTDNRD